MLVLCLLSSLVACSGETPDRGHDPPEPRRSPTILTTPERSTKEASEPAGGHVVENTVGGAVLRRDESVLRIGHAEQGDGSTERQANVRDASHGFMVTTPKQ